MLRRLLRAKDRMDAASHEEWPVRRLAAVSDVSGAYFARSFKQAFGVPPHRYLLTFYVDKLGLRVHTDVRNGDYRWLTVQLGLFTAGPPALDAATAQALNAIVAKGAMPPLVLAVDAGFRDPSGNGWKMIQARR